VLLIVQHLKSYLISFGSVIAQLDWAIQEKELDYPVKPDNDKHWNGVRPELSGLKLDLLCHFFSFHSFAHFFTSSLLHCYNFL